ncbi:ATP-binding protein [Thermospira aquatica]|uniref:histidine kinase n=1 Tax=Thermospira aquatica TaxID=2828656 RepID=A0AAX3BCK5_9SPIR|nr:ATP-binding protein [Thermospira aquatica]URA09866.1 PAS domain S-box protein [Thermospira aquatica]
MARLYIVEDDAIVSLYIKNFLKKNHDVIGSSASFQPAKEEIIDLKPDLVVSDIILLDKQGDGIKLAEEVNKVIFIPFIFLTGVAFNPTDERFQHIPVYGYITKPIDEQRLLSTVELALMRIASEKQLDAFTTKLQLEIKQREQVEEELRQTLYRHEHFINQLPDVVFEIDSEGKLTFVNKAVERFLGYLPEEILGTPVINLVSEESLFLSKQLFQMFQEDIVFQRVFTQQVYELSFQHKNGSIRWGRITFVPLVSQSGIIVGTQGILYDITLEKHQQKMLESRLKKLQQQKRYQTIIRYILEKINETLDPFPELSGLADFIRVSFGIDGVLIFRYEEGTSSLLQQISCFFYEDNLCKEPLKYTLSEEEKSLLTSVIYLREKTKLPERFHSFWDENNIKSATLFPLYFEKKLFGLLVCFWYTRKHLERSFFITMQIIAEVFAQAIHRHEEWEHHLDTEKKLADQKLLMEKAESMATFGQMMSAISHEIRQPLQSIRLLSESAVYWANHGKALPYEEILANMKKISQRVVRIDRIIEGMKQAALSTTSIKPERVKIASVIEESLDVLHDKLNVAQITVKKHLVHADLEVTFHPIQLNQVITNLLSNAIHALESQDPPRIIILETEEYKENSILCIKDNGPGIPPEKEKYIFEPFFTTRPGTGMGIGLYVVKRLLSLYGARITYQRENHWTIFEIIFPSSGKK